MLVDWSYAWPVCIELEVTTLAGTGKGAAAQPRWAVMLPLVSFLLHVLLGVVLHRSMRKAEAHAVALLAAPAAAQQLRMLLSLFFCCASLPAMLLLPAAPTLLLLLPLPPPHASGGRGGARALPVDGAGAAAHAAVQGRAGEKHHPAGVWVLRLRHVMLMV